MFRKWKDPLNSFKTNTKFKVLEHDKHMRCNNSLAHYATFKELIPKTRTVCMALFLVNKGNRVFSNLKSVE